MQRAAISWELLSRFARRYLASQLVWVLTGLLGPLALCLWTILRPFDLRQGYHYLQQCAIWLSGWYIAFSVLYTLNVWLRPRQQDADSDLKHLPLSSTHFFLKRGVELCLLPLFCFALTLPLWFCVLAYIQVPYGQLWMLREYTWGGDWALNPWALRILWVSLALLAAQLLPLALASWLDEATQYSALRIPLLLGAVAGGYFGIARLAEGYGQWSGGYGPLIMCYRQTRGYNLPSFILPPLILLGVALLSGMLPRRLRFVLPVPLGLLAGAILLLPLLPAADLAPFQPLLERVSIRDARQGIAWSLGHLSPPKNVRLIFGSYTSNVLLAEDEPLYEPAWPDVEDDPALSADENEARRQQLWDTYDNAMKDYEQRISKFPRLPMWAGAGAWPLTLALAIYGGLLLGYVIRRQPARDEA